MLCTQEDHLVHSAPLMPAGWDTFQKPGGVSGRCSVHWRTGLFTKDTARTLLLNLANGLTFPGAKREGAVVVLKDKRNGRRLKVTSAHFVPHADDDKRSGVITPMPRGAKAVKPAIRALIKDAADHPEDVQVVCGDFNIDLDNDLRIHDAGMVEQMAAAGFVTDVAELGPTPDTHGTQEYDQLYARGGRWVAHQTRAKGRSDHRAKTATLEY